MLVDALEHLDSPPARLSLLASNQHLPAVDADQLGNDSCGPNCSSGCAADWQALRAEMCQPRRSTACLPVSGRSVGVPHPVRVQQVRHGGALCQELGVA